MLLLDVWQPEEELQISDDSRAQVVPGNWRMMERNTKQTKRGLMISFEGQDGSGKSSAIEPLREWLVSQRREVVMTREPGGTPLAEDLRALLLHREMDSVTEAMLMFAARVEHVKKVILPGLEDGKVVLCDRFTDSSFAYQGGGRGLDVNVLTTLESMVQDGSGKIFEPDLTLWFDLSAEEALARRSSARDPDKFESQALDFFRKVSAGYEERMVKSNGRIVRIDAGQTKEKVLADVLQEVEEFFKRQ
jgi:dTMP kinase